MMPGLTVDNPITFQNAITSPRVLPGDVIVMRGGTYRGYWSLGIGGTEAQPVTIKPYNNEPVVIDGGLTFGKGYVHICDVEIMDSAPFVDVYNESVTMNQPGCWLIGCYIHDLHNSGVNWFGSGAGGVAECLISENNGYAIYTHNDAGSARLIARNLFTNQRNRYTLHIYSGGVNYLRDYTCEDNVIFGDPVHTGGGLGLKNFTYRRNIQYGDYCQHGRYTKDAGQNDGGQIMENLFIGLAGYSVNANSLNPWLNLTESDNIVWSAGGYGEPANRAGYTVEPTPATWSKFIPFQLSERWSGIQATLTDGVFSAVMVNK